MPIVLKSKEEIAIMREAGRILAQVLQLVVKQLRPGLVVKDLDPLVREEFARRGVEPTFLGYHGYPSALCISINDVIVHGIPGDQVIQDGDVVSIDLGCTYQGFVADSALTVGVGNVSPEAQKLIRVTEEALQKGIEA